MSAPTEHVDRGAVQRAAEVVWGGGVLVYPTETVYGLGCDPREADAIARVRAIKGRDADRPMLALTDEWERVKPWLAEVTEAHRRLMEHDPPPPVTLIFTASESAPEGLVSGQGEIGLRRTSDAFCRALVAACHVPLLSTSANQAGQPPAGQIDDLDAEIVEAVDLVLDAGHALGGTASTVVRVEEGKLVVVREGAVDAATLREIAERS